MKDIEKMSLKDLLEHLKPATIRIILVIFISLLATAITTSIAISSYFNSNLRELDKQKMELKFEEKQKILEDEHRITALQLTDQITILKTKCSSLEEKIDLLNSWIEFSNMDKQRVHSDKVAKAREKLLGIDK
jgi:hypothetical protein